MLLRTDATALTLKNYAKKSPRPISTYGSNGIVLNGAAIAVSSFGFLGVQNCFLD
jgi:hypothetical protein